MDIEEKVKNKLLMRGFSKETLLNNSGLIGATTDETILEVVKNLGIANVSNSTLLEVFEDAVCDRNYNPTSDDYNKSGYTYAELKAEIIDRLQSERA